jgi:hypothetical protein
MTESQEDILKEHGFKQHKVDPNMWYNTGKNIAISNYPNNTFDLYEYDLEFYANSTNLHTIEKIDDVFISVDFSHIENYLNAMKRQEKIKDIFDE